MTTPTKPTVVITGSSAGIGRATAHEFAKQGARIGLLARNRDGLEAAKREVEALGGEAVVCICDVAEPLQITAAADAVEAAFGPIDIWVNNAMVSFLAPLKEVTPEEYRRVTDVTYHGVVYGSMEALRRMRPRNAGSIVLVGSALAYRGVPLQTAYCGAKHAIQGFFDSLRAELIHEGSDIQVSMVQLPGMNTTQFKLTRNKMPNEPKPMGKVYEPEVAARAIVYAATHDEREVFVGWPTFQTIWSNKLFPGIGDRMLGNTGVSGQLTDQPADHSRPDYLFTAVPGDHGYKGGFGGKATSSSPLLWLTMNKWFGAALVGGVAAAGAAVLLKALGVTDGGHDDQRDYDDDDDRDAYDDGYAYSRYGDADDYDADDYDDRYGSRGAVGRDVFASRRRAPGNGPRYVDHTVYPDDAGGTGPGGQGYDPDLAYPEQDLSGIHGGAPRDFDHEGATQPGDVSLEQARRRRETPVLDGVD